MAEAKPILYQGPAGQAGTANANQFSDDNVDAAYRVTEVRVRHGKLVDSVQMVFKDYGGNQVVVGQMYGGHGGQMDSFTVDADNGEYLVAMFGRTGKTVDSIGFVTSTGKTSPKWGGPGGSDDFRFDVPDGYSIIGFTGRWGNNDDEGRDTLGSIGIAYRLL